MVLPLWLLLIPVFTYGLLAYVRRARLGQRLPAQPLIRPKVRNLILSWVAGHAVFSGLYDVNELTGGVLEQTVMFTLCGAVAYLFAANAEMFKRWVWMDLLARMLAEIGLLGYVAALVALQMQEDNSGLLNGIFLVGAALLWLAYHLGRLAVEPGESGRLAGASGATV